MVDTAFDTLDTLHNFACDIPDTSTVSIVGTTVVSVADLPKDSQPNGWVQLLLPIFITLLVVFIDKWVTRHYEHKDAKARRKQYCETVLDWILKIQPIENTFLESIKELGQRIKDSDDLQPVPFAMPLTLHDKLNDMSIEKMSDAFLRDFKDDKDRRYANMYNIISNFEFLTRISSGVKETYDSYNKQAFTLCQEWNSAYMAFLERYYKMPKGNPYDDCVQTWLMELLQNPNSVIIHIKYTSGLSLIAGREKDHDTLSLVNKMLRIANQSQATSKGFATVFFDMATNIETTLQSLSDAEKYFRNNGPL